jgi:hypothetical protein
MEKENDKNSSNYIALKSLKERIAIQKKLIEVIQLINYLRKDLNKSQIKI